MSDAEPQDPRLPADDIPVEEEVSMEEVAGIVAAVFAEAGGG